MNRIALRKRSLGDAELVVDASGAFFRRLRNSSRLLDEVPSSDRGRIGAGAANTTSALDSLARWAHEHAVVSRRASLRDLDYLIMVPTLRCNLTCSYCQVSRAALSSTTHDWNEKTLSHVLNLIDSLAPRPIKIEFQGGEPTLRPDLITAVIERCDRFTDRTFVICTNLSRVDPTTLALFDRPDVFISTSLDGNLDTHRRNRTESTEATNAFQDNFAFMLNRYGPGKISALPTIDPANPPSIDDLINAFTAREVNAIFLRPINFHGFARKRHGNAVSYGEAWRAYYEAFVRELVRRNWADRTRVLEETYFSLCLRRVMQPGHDRHVDLRNPNPLGQDYIVVDHDGVVYPTDESRMLSRAGVINLAIGDVATGWDTAARTTINAHSTNLGDPDCDRCAYQPFCGRDIIDDLARYGRIDMPRTETEFCRRHLHVFDLVFKMIYSDDPAARYSISRWLRLPGDQASFGKTLSD